jgi:predicted phage replisome organizer
VADDKKYYYLKVKENFFDSEQMIVLESMQDGHLYSNILLKLYLRSLKNEGKLMFNDRIPYNSNILSQVVRHSVGVVEKAISIFKEFGLIEVMDNGAIYMLDIQNYIGQSSTEADRQRDYQRRISEEKGMLLLPECKKSNRKPNRKTTPEIELDIEKEKEIIVQGLKMTTKEYNKLISLYTQSVVDEKIEQAKNYKGLSTKYVSLYLTLNKWLKKDAEDKPKDQYRRSD